LPEFRGRGYAVELMEHIKTVAVEQGYHRLTSLCQTYNGYCLQRKLGHQFWGLRGRYHDGRMREGAGKLLVDAPLRTDWPFPTGIPLEAQHAINPHLWNEEELEAYWIKEKNTNQ
jgi:GNAT superfamily N-acetyltransferase